jgi:hypothetical protein
VEPLDESTFGVWFGGGNIARPDENLNGQIGYGILRITASAPAETRYSPK